MTKKRLLYLFLFANFCVFGQSHSISSPITKDKVEDLAITCKVWGFLKYYHPSVRQGNYDWDNELLKRLPQIINSDSARVRNELLSDWIVKLGEIKEINSNYSIDSLKTKVFPNNDWLEDRLSLGDKLSKQLINIKYAKRNNESYYVELVPRVGNPLFKHEASYSQYPLPDSLLRVLSLFRYWNIINYFYPYKYLIEEDWDSILKEYIPRFVDASTEKDYRLAILSLMAHVHDSHAYIVSQDKILLDIKGGKFRAPIKLAFIENKLVVTQFHFTKDTYKTELSEGDIITEINSKAVDTIVKEKLPFYPASNYITQLRNIAKDILRTNDSTIKITYIHNNTVRKTELRAKANISERHLFKTNMDDSTFRTVAPGIICINNGLLKKEQLPVLWQRMQNSTGVIIDMRNYPADFLVYNLSYYLVPDSIPFTKLTVGSVVTPGLFTFQSTLKVGQPNKDYYKGKIVILVNEETQSSAEFHAMAYKTAPKAIIIGSTTAGADGNISQFALPGGITTAISGIGIYYPNGGETQRIGIIPDIEVHPTIKSIGEGRDELIEKAIRIINSGN